MAQNTFALSVIDWSTAATTAPAALMEASQECSLVPVSASSGPPPSAICVETLSTWEEVWALESCESVARGASCVTMSFCRQHSIDCTVTTGRFYAQGHFREPDNWGDERHGVA